MLAKDQQVGGYIVEEEIGGGGMARLYRVRHAALDTLHALKVLQPSYRVIPEVRSRFLAEAKIGARLDHPNIVRVTDIVSTAEVAGIVMELIEGPNLEQYIRGLQSRPTAAEVRALFLPVLDAVGELHRRGIIHRDIKPANILLKPHGAGVVPKVTDFGVAKVGDEIASLKLKGSTHADARMGTIAYMSPEQIRRAKEVTARSDIFSLGATLYELATCSVAFDGDSEYDIMHKIVEGQHAPPSTMGLDASIAAAIERALEPDPERRFASCEEFAQAIAGGAPVAVAGVALPALATSISGAVDVREQFVRQHRGLLGVDPLRFESYRALVGLYREMGELDLAWCFCAALLHHRQLLHEEQFAFFEEHRVAGQQRHARSVTDAVWRDNLLHARNDRTASALLAEVWRPAALLVSEPHASLGLKRKSRLVTGEVVAAFSNLALALGVIEPEIFVGAIEGDSSIQFANCHDGQLVPSIIVGRELLHVPAEHLAFRAARVLTMFRPEHYLFAVLTQGELRVTFLACLRLCRPDYPLPQKLHRAVENRASTLSTAGARKWIGPLTALVEAFVANPAHRVDVPQWAQAIELTADRAAFVIVKDLSLAVRLLGTDPDTVPLPERQVELAQWAITEPYFELRRRLGIAIPSTRPGSPHTL